MADARYSRIGGPIQPDGKSFTTVIAGMAGQGRDVYDSDTAISEWPGTTLDGDVEVEKGRMGREFKCNLALNYLLSRKGH